MLQQFGRSAAVERHGGTFSAGGVRNSEAHGFVNLTVNQRDPPGGDSFKFMLSESITQVLQSCAAKYASPRYGSNSGRFFFRFFLERFNPHSGLLH